MAARCKTKLIDLPRYVGVAAVDAESAEQEMHVRPLLRQQGGGAEKIVVVLQWVVARDEPDERCVAT